MYSPYLKLLSFSSILLKSLSLLNRATKEGFATNVPVECTAVLHNQTAQTNRDSRQDYSSVIVIAVCS